MEKCWTNLIDRLGWALHGDLPVVDVMLCIDRTSRGRLGVDVGQLLHGASVECSDMCMCAEMAYLENALVLGSHDGRRFGSFLANR